MSPGIETRTTFVLTLQTIHERVPKKLRARQTAIVCGSPSAESDIRSSLINERGKSWYFTHIRSNEGKKGNGSDRWNEQYIYNAIP